MIPLTARLHQNMTRRAKNRKSSSDPSSSCLEEGSFAQSIGDFIENQKGRKEGANHEDEEIPPSSSLECDSDDSCSSSSSFGEDYEAEFYEDGIISQLGSFPTTPSPSDGLLPVVFEEEEEEDFLKPNHLPVLLEEDEYDQSDVEEIDCETLSLKSIQKKGMNVQEKGTSDKDEPIVHEKTISVTSSSSKIYEQTRRNFFTQDESQYQEPSATTSLVSYGQKDSEQHIVTTSLKHSSSDSSELTTDEAIHSSSSKTICSNTDATCQTLPVSISQDSIGDVSLEYSYSNTCTTQKVNEELDSRLNAILALKEVVFAQRLAIKHSTKEKQRLATHLSQRTRRNQKLHQRNQRLEKELASMKEQLRLANSKLLKYELQQEAEHCEEYSVQEQESIFELLHKINDVRKTEEKIDKREQKEHKLTEEDKELT